MKRTSLLGRAVLAAGFLVAGACGGPDLQGHGPGGQTERLSYPALTSEREAGAGTSASTATVQAPTFTHVRER